MPSNDVHSEELRKNLKHAIHTTFLHFDIRGYHEDDDTPYVLLTKAFEDAGWLSSSGVANAVREARKESAKRLQTKLTKYGDGEIAYHNGEATVPISEVLAELAGSDRIQSLNETKETEL